MAKDGRTVIATKLHCIKCGIKWGDGEDLGSSGICPDCFIEWAKTKRHCFGIDMTCNEMYCSFYKFCKEYYGIK